MHYFLPLLLTCMLMLTGEAGADDYEGAMAAFDRGDFAAALPIVRRLAEAGHAPAQNTLGVMFDQGLGLPPDIAQAVAWFRAAAAQNDGKALANLGVLHEQGRGVPQDDAEAVRWYRLAAARHRGVAENNLAAMLVQGRGTARDVVEAYVLFDRASRDFPMERDRKAAIDNRDAVANLLTPKQLSEARRRIAESGH